MLATEAYAQNGVTQKAIKAIKKEFNFFTERLDHFMKLSNMVIVAPGGIGTLLELSYVWQLVQVNRSTMPIILFGDMWINLLDWMKKWQLKRKFINKEDLDDVYIAKNIDEVMELIKKFYMIYKKTNQ